MIEIHPKGRTHKHFQKLLNEFQAIFDLKQLECQNHQRKLKRKEESHFMRVRNDDDSNEDDEIMTENETNKNIDRNMDESNRAGGSIDNFEELLQWAENRTATPTFDLMYEGLFQSYQETKNRTNFLLNECKTDSEVHFVLEDSIHECCDLLNSDLHWACKQDRLMKDCPNTCAAIMNQTNYNQNMNDTAAEDDDAKTESPSPALREPSRPIWNPFWPRIINSIHFYGYGGSLTEPPCSEWLAWRVLDTPMQISQEQWDQMRNILFNQVDEQCRRTSVHWDGSVARPTQSLNGRSLWKCTENDYVSDVEKRMGLEQDDD